MARDWNTLCDLVKDDDDLPVRDCGYWTEDKLYFWHQYLGITTSAMAGKRVWEGGLVYVDLFAGPGVCRVRTSGKRLPGSPLIAAHAPKQFSRILLVEEIESLADACEKRMRNSPASDRFQLFRSDCNTIVTELVRSIPKRALTLALIDPTGLDIHFATLRTLAENRRVDFLLYFADAIDLVRNVDRYEAEDESKLDLMFGERSGWRESWPLLENRTGANIRSFFSELYKAQIKKILGYEGFRERPIKGPHGPLYSLIYASKHEKGLEFWDKISHKDRLGQGELF